MDISVIFGQMLVLLAMMVVGYFAYKKSWLDDASCGKLSKLVVNVTNPLLVINAVLGKSSQDGGDKILQNIGFVFVYFVIVILFSAILPYILRAGKYRKSLCQGMSVFGNIGFMGIPVIQSIFGKEAVVYVAFYTSIYNILIYTYGVFLARRAGVEWAFGQTAASGSSEVVTEENQIEKSKGSTLRRMINPGVVAAVIAVIIFMSGITVPNTISTFCDYMGNITIPLSMMLIGVSVAQANLKAVFGEWRMYAYVLLRMLALPVVMCLLLRTWLVTGGYVDSVVFGVFIIELGMPIGSIIGMLMREEGADAGFCMRGVVLTTLASIVTIPLICVFL